MTVKTDGTEKKLIENTGSPVRVSPSDTEKK